VVVGNQLLKGGVYLIVRLLFLLRLAAIACIGVIATGRQAAGCQCGATNFFGRSSWDLAKLEAEDSAVIFEGIPERFELQWNVLSAKEGELISAENVAAKGAHYPGMLVIFRVQKSYKGDPGPEIQIKTGLGGGDCGAVFAPGLTYLVFAHGISANDFGVSMCSPGGWIGGNRAAAELRYLRKERPIASDLVPWTVERYQVQAEQGKRDYEEFRKRYASVTGKICGTVLTQTPEGSSFATLSFLSTAGYSPAEHPTAQVNEDGSFCSDRLGPGKYQLYFMSGLGGSQTSALFYPGVSERSKATTIEVSAGQTLSGITFKVPLQKTYSVRGIISANDTSGLEERSVYVSLVNLDGTPRQSWYSQPIDFQNPLPLPKVKYFNFENVLPGRYIAYISVFGDGWYTKKEEVTVTTHMKFISLELIHKK
jgi:hypothetical protein